MQCHGRQAVHTFFGQKGIFKKYEFPYYAAYIRDLFIKQINKTVPWNYNEDTVTVAGWQTNYDGISFLSVRGSGHFVPGDKPREALQMMANFIRNKPYSTSTGINTTPQPLLTK